MSIQAAEVLEQIDELTQELYKCHQHFVPMYPWVLVMLCTKEQEYHGIILPENQNKIVHEGIVLSTWQQKIFERGHVTVDGIRRTRCEVEQSELSFGDHVLFQHYAGKPVPGFDRDRFRIVKEKNWSFTDDGGIFAYVRYPQDHLDKPLEELMAAVWDEWDREQVRPLSQAEWQNMLDGADGPESVRSAIDAVLAARDKEMGSHADYQRLKKLFLERLASEFVVVRRDTPSITMSGR